MDAVAPLAGQLVQLLAPFLPYLLKAGEGFVPLAAEQIGNQGRELAAKLWVRLSAKIASKPAAQEAAADLAAQPSDPDAQAALRVQLRKLLADDPDLQRELQTLLDASQPGPATNTVTASGDRSVAIGRDVRGSTISTGDQRTDNPKR